MEAKDFLAQDKRRMLRLEFPDLPVYDSFGGLLDVGFSETMSDSPDVEIGNLVIPELSVTLGHTNLKDHIGDRIEVKMGLEQSREDVSGEIQAIQAADTSELLSFARSANGCWFVGAGTILYSCWFDAAGKVHLDALLSLEQSICAVCLLEERVYLDENGRVTNNYGIVYLFFDAEPYLRRFTFVAHTPLSDFQYTGFQVMNEIETPEIIDPLHLAVVKDIAKKHASITRSMLHRNGTADEEQIMVTDICFSRYYDDSGTLVRRALSGEATSFRTASYGEFTLTETSSQDEETTELICYGILGEIAGINAEPFLEHPYFRFSSTFADVYRAIILWLNTIGYAITAAPQTFLNLDKIPFVFQEDEADRSGVTVGDLLRELAMLEGGNACLNHDGLLELGWCVPEPVITVSAEALSAMRIGTERLRPADGIKFLHPKAENRIDTTLEEKDLFLAPFAEEGTYPEALRRIVESFSANQHIPFSADALVGASPFLRAGDSLRLVSRSGAAVILYVFMQDISHFPFPESHISAPEGTRWRTEPVDFNWQTVDMIEVKNWPEYIIDGEPPDTSDMLVTAHQRNDQTFVVDSTLYQVTTEPRDYYPDIVIMTVTFCGKSKSQDVKVYYPLYTGDGKPMTTSSGELLVVKGVD